MNKRAFTLIELLAVIVIIALLVGIGTVAYSSIADQASNKSFQSYRDTMHAEAVHYMSNNYNSVVWTNNSVTLTLSDLKIDPINNPKNKNDLCQESNVTITRSRHSVSGVLSMSYNVCLRCNDFNECKVYDN